MKLSRLEQQVLALGDSLTRAIAVAEGKVTTLVEQAFSVPRGRREYRLRRVEIAAILNEVDVLVSREAPGVVLGAFGLGRQIADDREWVKRFAPDSSFNSFDREAIRLLTDNLISSLGDANQTVGRRADDIFRRVALKATLETYAKAELPHAFNSDLLKQKLQNEGLTAFVDSSGKVWSLERYSSMAIHTMRSEAANQGIANRMLSRGFFLYDVNNPELGCPICKPYIGNTYSLAKDEQFEGVEYKVADRLPPYHPHCYCFITPSPIGVRMRQEAA